MKKDVSSMTAPPQPGADRSKGGSASGVAKEPPSLPLSDPPHLRVLVVEDDPDALASTLDALQALGHWATGVQSAEVALSRFFESAFDLLITDVGLPALSGEDLVQKIRLRHGLPVVFATGRAEPAHLPADAVWLRKPYDLQQLREALARAVAVRR